MAWIDDRVWCHPKLVDVSKGARWTWVAGITYSSGFHTCGRLTNGQVAQIGATSRERRELVTAGLWHEIQGGVEINDWDEHNSKRDERRRKDRERKRKAREEGRWNEADRARPNTRTGRAPQGAPACVDGSEGSDGSERTSRSNSEAVTRPATPADPTERPSDFNNIQTLISESLREAAA